MCLPAHCSYCSSMSLWVLNGELGLFCSNDRNVLDWNFLFMWRIKLNQEVQKKKKKSKFLSNNSAGHELLLLNVKNTFVMCQSVSLVKSKWNICSFIASWINIDDLTITFLCADLNFFESALGFGNSQLLWLFQFSSVTSLNSTQHLRVLINHLDSCQFPC